MSKEFIVSSFQFIGKYLRPAAILKTTNYKLQTTPAGWDKFIVSSFQSIATFQPSASSLQTTNYKLQTNKHHILPTTGRGL
jgi:hypothetical protein